MRREQGEEPELGARQSRPVALARRAQGVDLGPQLRGLLREDAQAGPAAQEVERFRQQ